MFWKKQICPKCKTGKESYELDQYSDICPYIDYWKSGKCPFYKPFPKKETPHSISRVIKRLLNL